MVNLSSKINGGVVLTLGRVGGAFFGFFRNILLARLLSVEDYGIAAIYALTIAILELLSDLGADKILVQSRDGARKRLQDAVQFISFLKGVASTIALFFFAPMLANYFGKPEIQWSLQILSLSPLVHGLTHFDFSRFLREYNYLPAALIFAVPQLLTLLATIPICLYYKNYSAALALNLMQTFLQVAVSHLLAKRRYGWAVEKKLLLQIYEFGWPLLLSGSIAGVIAQGDRILIGGLFSVTELGIFTAGFNIVYLVSSIIIGVIQTYYLPMISNKSIRFPLTERAAIVGQVSVLIGGIIALGYGISGVAIVKLIFGDKYSLSYVWVMLLAAMQGLRVARAGIIISCVAIGNTKASLVVSCTRLIFFGLAILLMLRYPDIELLLTVSLCGELVAFCLSVFLLKRNMDIRQISIYLPFGMAVLSTILIYKTTLEYVVSLGEFTQVFLGVVFCLCVLFCVIGFPTKFRKRVFSFHTSGH